MSQKRERSWWKIGKDDGWMSEAKLGYRPPLKKIDLSRKKILPEVGLPLGLCRESGINSSFSCMKIEMIKSKNLDFHQG